MQPSMLSRFTRLALQRAARLSRAIMDRDTLVTTRMSGVIESGTRPLTVEYLGRQRFARDFAVFFERAEGAAPSIVTERETLWSFFRKRFNFTGNNAPADVTLIDTWLQESEPSVLYAPHFNALLTVAPTFEAQCQLMTSKSHRRKIQAANKHGIVWRKSNADADFNLFYDVMYAPFVAQRFGDDAAVVPRDRMHKIFRERGFLLMIEEDGKPVSAALMDILPHQPDTLHYWKYGLADAVTLAPHVFGERNAATEAVVLRYAVEQGFKTLDFGLTRALPNNGIYIHKKRVGCTFFRHVGTPTFSLSFKKDVRPEFTHHVPLVVEVDGVLQEWSDEVAP